MMVMKNKSVGNCLSEEMKRKLKMRRVLFPPKWGRSWHPPRKSKERRLSQSQPPLATTTANIYCIGPAELTHLKQYELLLASLHAQPGG